MNDAFGFVRRCYDPGRGTFLYEPHWMRKAGRGMAGAGIVCMFLAGYLDRPEAKSAADYILASSFVPYRNSSESDNDYYHYAAYTCAQAMFLMGGDYWASFFPTLARELVHHDGLAPVFFLSS